MATDHMRFARPDHTSMSLPLENPYFAVLFYTAQRHFNVVSLWYLFLVVASPIWQHHSLCLSPLLLSRLVRWCSLTIEFYGPSIMLYFHPYNVRAPEDVGVRADAESKDVL